MSSREQTAKWLTEAMKHHQANEFADAEPLYRRVLERDKRNANATHYLGLLLSQTGRVEEAIEWMRRAIMLNPSAPHFHSNLAEAMRRAGFLEDALVPARKAAELQPAVAEHAFTIGLILQDLRRRAEAVPAYQRAIAIQPDHVKSHGNLGQTLVQLGLLEEALAAYQRGSRCGAEVAQFMANWSLALMLAGRYEEAAAKSVRALELDPNDSVAEANLGRCASFRFDLDSAIKRLRRSLELKPSAAATRSAMLFVALHHPGISDEQLLEDHAEWGRIHAPPVSPTPAIHVEPIAGRPLRIGFVSADFRNHPVAYFIEPILSHASDSVDIVCYSNSPPAELDETSQRLKSYRIGWRDVSDMSDAKLAKLIRDGDKIDVLVDLSGHTQNHRLEAFALHPAPVQVSYLGYQGTSGVEAIGYRLTDALVDPPGQTDSFYTEQLIRLHVFACYSVPPTSPEVAPAPCVPNGYVTFGAYTKIEKISDRTLDLWSAALQRVDRAKLIVFASALQDASLADALRRMFTSRGIAPERVELIGAQSFTSYLESHSRVDLLLDSFPFNAHTTACHALWMGVPTITLAGTRYASRMGLALNTHLGLPQLIARSAEEFVEIAASEAAAVDAIAARRATLRQRFASSPLMDAAGFAADFESKLRGIFPSGAEDSP